MPTQLRALAGEQEGDAAPAAASGCSATVHAVRLVHARPRRRAAASRARASFAREIVERLGDERERRTPPGRRAPPRASVGARPLEPRRRADVERSRELVDGCDHLARVAPRHSSSSAGQRGTARSRSLEVAALYSSSTTWKLVPPKPKALTAARRGCGARPREPRPRLGVHVERALGEVRLRVRLADAERRRQHPVVQGERRLDQARHAGGRLGVADHRLHRAERAPLVLRRSARRRRCSACTSAPSPATVPVPWASTRPTVAGDTPACA